MFNSPRSYARSTITGSALELSLKRVSVAKLARLSEGRSTDWEWMLAPTHPFNINNSMTSITQSRQFHSADLSVGGLLWTTSRNNAIWLSFTTPI